MKNILFDKKEFIKCVKDNVKTLYRKTMEEASEQEVFQAVSYAVKDVIIDNWLATQQTFDKEDPKMVYYMSMEFLMGRALGNNLINLTAYKEVKEALDEIGFDLNMIEDQEPDPALGNGGLGRLAACFMDSLATLGYAAYGCGIRYRYGMFKQKIKDGYQVEVPDNWLKNGYPFELRRPEHSFEVKFGGYVQAEPAENGRTKFVQKNYQSVLAVPYDMPISGYGTNNIARLRLWKAQSPIALDMKLFSSGEYLKALEKHALAETISMVLYPEDNHREGQSLRLKQQYFLVSATLQDICAKHKAKYGTLENFAHKHVLHINDTHPTLVIPELMRILMDENDMSWEQAWNITSQSVAYTNHTVMPEALEKWDCNLVQQLLPAVYDIILRIEEQFMTEMYQKGVDKAQANRMKLVQNGMVHMAHIAVYASAHTNGVAAIHTEILKDSVLKDWYQVYPERFQNKTNGITQRRWLALCNPELSGLLTELLGSDDWKIRLDELKKLERYADDTAVLERFLAIKQTKKEQLAAYIAEKEGVQIDPNSIFDIQIKRLHEYKRQLLNAFSILYLYFGLKDGSIADITPVTFLFGAKSAPGYRRAKAIIKFIHEVAKLVEADPVVSQKIKVVFVSNYNVSYAEKLVAAADVSEQISTAGTEASGTGNMKLMLNGAVTLGTYDGANIEIVEEAGEENNYIFGAKVEELEKIMPTYDSRKLFSENAKIRRVVETLIDGTCCDGGSGDFRELYYSLLDGASWHTPDNYYLLGDLESYVAAKLRCNGDYTDRMAFAKKQWLNICNAGKFSSDRTIADYAENIWDIQPVKVD